MNIHPQTVLLYFFIVEICHFPPEPVIVYLFNRFGKNVVVSSGPYTVVVSVCSRHGLDWDRAVCKQNKRNKTKQNKKRKTKGGASTGNPMVVVKRLHTMCWGEQRSSPFSPARSCLSRIYSAPGSGFILFLWSTVALPLAAFSRIWQHDMSGFSFSSAHPDTLNEYTITGAHSK